MSRLNPRRYNGQNLNYVSRLISNPPQGYSREDLGKWKGDKWNNRTTGSAVPTSSQPQTNLSVNSCPGVELVGANGVAQPCYERAFRGLPGPKPHQQASGTYRSNRGSRGPLNPIKHWRKQLQPSQGHVTGKPTIDQVIWTPGGSTHLGSTRNQNELKAPQICHDPFSASSCRCGPTDCGMRVRPGPRQLGCPRQAPGEV